MTIPPCHNLAANCQITLRAHIWRSGISCIEQRASQIGFVRHDFQCDFGENSSDSHAILKIEPDLCLNCEPSLVFCSAREFCSVGRSPTTTLHHKIRLQIKI